MTVTDDVFQSPMPPVNDDAPTNIPANPMRAGKRAAVRSSHRVPNNHGQGRQRQVGIASARKRAERRIAQHKWMWFSVLFMSVTDDVTQSPMPPVKDDAC